MAIFVAECSQFFGILDIQMLTVQHSIWRFYYSVIERFILLFRNVFVCLERKFSSGVITSVLFPLP